MYTGIHVKYPLFLSNFLMKLEFSRQKNTPVSNFMDIRPVAAELFHADRRTDMTRQVVNFRNITNTPKNCCMFIYNAVLVTFPVAHRTIVQHV
jgi:hypothetical protein